MAEGQQFKLPDVGEGLTEADIVTWHVKVGDAVSINEALVEVETAKAAVDLPSPYAGVVAALHFAEGDTVEVGAPIITIAETRGTQAGSDATDAQTPRPASESPPDELGGPWESPPIPVATVDEERQNVLVGYGPTRTTVARRPRKNGTRRPAGMVTSNRPVHRPHATPPVRALARQLGIDLATVQPTGERGQITRTDLRNAQSALAAGQAAPARPAETRKPIKGVRKRTAEAMVASAFTAPHVTEWITVDMTRSLKLIDRLRTDKSFSGVRLSPLVLVMRATLLALSRNPEANAKWDDAAGEIVQFHDVNLGVAAATPRGLVVPNIRAAQSLRTVELAQALEDLIVQARTGKTRPEAMQKGTFTITNIGVFGVDAGTPILNPGEAAILCLGGIRRQPWEHKGKIKLRHVGTLALSFDHRLIDGELGSRLLADVARLLEDPALALAH